MYLSRLAPDYPNTLIYKAKLDDGRRTVVVKFVTIYNAQSHHMLTKHPLASTLRYAGTNDTQASLYCSSYEPYNATDQLLFDTRQLSVGQHS